MYSIKEYQTLSGGKYSKFHVWFLYFPSLLSVRVWMSLIKNTDWTDWGTDGFWLLGEQREESDAGIARVHGKISESQLAVHNNKLTLGQTVALCTLCWESYQLLIYSIGNYLETNHWEPVKPVSLIKRHRSLFLIKYVRYWQEGVSQNVLRNQFFFKRQKYPLGLCLDSNSLNHY